MIKSFLIVSCILLSSLAFGQHRMVEINRQLDSLAVEVEGLLEETEMSLNNSPIHDLVRALGMNHGINITVDPDLTFTVTYNFSNARVKDVILFLCKEYGLTVELTGSIIALQKYDEPPPPAKQIVVRKPGVEYHPTTDFLSLDLKGDSLSAVAKEITALSLHNVILSPGIKDHLINVYIQNRPFDLALEKMAFANGLVLIKGDDNFYTLKSNPDFVDPELSADNNTDNRGRSKSAPKYSRADQSLDITELENGRLTIDAQNIPISDIIEEVSHQLNKNYYLYNKVDDVVSLLVDNASYTEFLNYILNGTNYTYKEQERVFMIGERNLEGLRKTELVKMENRPIENVIKKIPPDIQKNIQIFEYEDLNSLILSGSYPDVVEVKSFLRQIDQVVPMVYIEVIITDYNKNMIRSGGIKVGVGGNPTSTSIDLTEGADVTLGAGSVNNILASLSGFGVFNLGRVTPNFYVNIQALESNGVLNTRSTPKLSTVNGSEANLSVGRTEYYLEVQNNLIGTQNPVQQTTQNYKSVNADLSVKIKPMVSADDQVTMDITVSQSDFTERITQDAPPGSVSRSFSSRIRVRDGEMIVLGGLETESTGKTGSGLPWIVKIPVLNWFFGNQQKTKGETKLAIFIKPTIIY